MLASRRSVVVLVLGAFAFCATLPTAAQSAGTLSLTAKSSDGAGVRIVVKPKAIGGGPVWEFEVTMDTHTRPLDDDLTKSAVLVDENGRRYAAAGWQGDPPGSHHRKGILRFPAPTEPTKSFEVQMQGVGGVDRRVFQWSEK